jgi:hypothetical protein
MREVQAGLVFVPATDLNCFDVYRRRGLISMHRMPWPRHINVQGHVFASAQ